MAVVVAKRLPVLTNEALAFRVLEANVMSVPLVTANSKSPFEIDVTTGVPEKFRPLVFRLRYE